ncbi:MAG: VWA domain-containing protein [Pyrinomonadaceae bacterium]|nr:VWA domain-containing protein [Pyrinomonadaceae bacterium]MCX7640346.1 VWA domain-containing protein [Pyrinomonadaceae bacterium]MDW8304773.1 VWA domain-containing protein [Acidobacteriota bacterium]
MKKLSLLTLLLFGLAVFAQDSEQEVIRVESRLVLVPVSVLDSKGNPIEGLTENDFLLKEEGKLQKIDSVLRAEQTPLEVAILFDVSASTESIYELQREALIQFLQEVVRPEDYASVFLIGEEPVLLQKRAKLQEVVEAIEKIKPSKQYTAFYDTVALAAEYLRLHAPSHVRKVIVAITDGEDTNSKQVAKSIQQGYKILGSKIDTLDSKSLYELTVKFRDEAVAKENSRVLSLLQSADVVFYSINLSGSSYKLNKISKAGQKSLEKLAEETGGTAYLSTFQSTKLKDVYQNQINLRLNKEMLATIFLRIANELRKQYLIEYYSEADFPEGKFVKLEVNLARPGAFQIKARKGYFVQSRN